MFTYVYIISVAFRLCEFSRKFMFKPLTNILSFGNICSTACAQITPYAAFAAFAMKGVLQMNNTLFKNGEFFVGVNYWASNAGIQMWNRWDEVCVRRDLDRLSEANIKVVRMFPLWSDFQPIEVYRAEGNVIRCVSRNAVEAISSPEALAGIDPIMVERLDKFLKMCEERNIKVILGLLTGWMSGRVYIPRALEGLNLYTSPLALRWEIRYIKYLVNRYKSCPAIFAWDLGNECNCFDKCPDADAAYTWSSIISDAVKSIDGTRPVVSGMHGLSTENVWTAQDQGETTDILCTHPYPGFTPLCDTDPVNRMKSANHSVAESVFYRGIGQKPCFCEEINVLGPMFANEELTCAYTDMALFGLWSHNCLGFMWWCACNQSKLTDTPYDWTGLERELGLIYNDGSHAPMLDRMTAFTKFTEDFGALPERIVDAVCLIMRKQDAWLQSYGTFLLAKQAGLDIEFSWCENALPRANAYILPGLQLNVEPTKRLWSELLKRVHDDGASLYISADGCMMSEFRETTGFELISRSRSLHEHTMNFGNEKIEINTTFDMLLKAKTATVLAYDERRNPVFGVNRYGKGKIYFMSAQLESFAAQTPSFADGENARDYYRIYKAMELSSPQKVAKQSNPTIGMTEHIADEHSRYLALINYEPYAQEVEVSIADYTATEIKSVALPLNFKSAQTGSFTIELPANCGAVVKIVK